MYMFAAASFLYIPVSRRISDCPVSTISTSKYSTLSSCVSFCSPFALAACAARAACASHVGKDRYVGNRLASRFLESEIEPHEPAMLVMTGTVGIDSPPDSWNLKLVN